MRTYTELHRLTWIRIRLNDDIRILLVLYLLDIKLLTALVAPHIFRQFRKIHVRITVALNPFNLVSTTYFYLVHRIILSPFQHQLVNPFTHNQAAIRIYCTQSLGRSPQLQSLVFIPCFACRNLKVSKIAVNRCHVEICTGKISLPLVCRLPYRLRSAVTRINTLAYLHNAIVESITGSNHSDRVITLTLIGSCIARIQVKQILVCKVLYMTPPAVSPYMLYIHSAHITIVRREIAGRITVSVTHRTVIQTVGLVKTAPRLSTAPAIAQDLNRHTQVVYGINQCRHLDILCKQR